MLLLAPALFAASIYMVLSRIILVLHAEHLTMIDVRKLTRASHGATSSASRFKDAEVCRPHL